MKSILTLTLLAVIIFSCHRSSRTPPHATQPDSLRIAITAFNLSEDVSGNDEVLILLYHYNDTLKLNEPIVKSRLTFRSKNSSRYFKIKLNEDIREKPLLLFFLEQDSELPIPKLDSTLRVSHVAIRKLFASKNYTGLEKYLEDEDILGIKSIPALPCPQPYVISISGIYKLDKYEYEVKVECF
jgi:hypothetical protein